MSGVQEGARSQAVPPVSLLSDQLTATIAEWDRMDPALRPVEIESFVLERTGLKIPKPVRIERLEACALKWLEQPPDGVADRREIRVDPAYYRPVLDRLNKKDSLRKIQKFFLDHTGFCMSHGQLTKYAQLASKGTSVAGSPSDQADLIRGWMRSRKVRDLVKEGNQGDRKAYIDRLAKVTERGLRDRQRALEAELRAMQNAKSPFEAGVKAARDLYEHAQYIHSVGKTVGDMPLFCVEEVDDALEDLVDQIALVRDEIVVIRAAHNGSPEVQSTVVIDAEETWQE